MDNSWVKLYRKIIDNEVLYDDKALRVFIYLLCAVNKKTGKTNISRHRTSINLKLNPNTFKDILKRLEKKYKIITSNSTNQFTEISLLNWAKYNPHMETTPALTPTKHQRNTNETPLIQDNNNTNVLLLENREREDIYAREGFLDNKDFQDTLREQFPSFPIEEEIEKMKDWLRSKGETRKDYAAFARNWLRKAKSEISEEVAIIRA